MICHLCGKWVREKAVFGTTHFCLTVCEIARKHGYAHGVNAVRLKRHGFLWLKKDPWCTVDLEWV